MAATPLPSSPVIQVEVTAMVDAVEDRAHMVFADLKRRGLVTAKCRLKKSSVANFKAGTLHFRTIYYNCKYGNLSEEYLRFILMHEEGHHRLKQNSHIVIAMDMAVALVAIAISMYYSLAQGLDLSPVVSIFIPFWAALLLFSLRVYQGPIQDDEYASDKFAVNALKSAYGIARPSKVADGALRAVPSSLREGSWKKRVLVLLFGGMHPTTEERILRIEREVDDQQDGAQLIWG